MSTEPLPPVSPVTPVAEDRTVAILSYLTIFGFIVAIVMHSSKKTALGSFHLRQTLGLYILAIGVWIAAMVMFFVLAFIPVLGPIVAFLLWAALFAAGIFALIYGLIGAIKGETKPIPVIGPPIQKHLANTFT
jgi:uncharacterized membrane protein